MTESHPIEAVNRFRNYQHLMGLYDTVKIGTGVSLPEFPPDLDPQVMRWQTKDLGQPTMSTYKITGDGRLLRREVTYRAMTAAEKEEVANDNGFDSWEAYTDAVETATPSERLEQGLPMMVREQVEDDKWWADHNQHGTFEFHARSPESSEFDIYWSYEARFTRGTLDEIVFLGDRDGGMPKTEDE